MVNVTNGKIIRLLVEDEPFDVRYGVLRQPRAGAGLPRGRAAPHRRVGVPDRPEGAGLLHPTGLVHPARGGRRSSTWSRRSTTPSRSSSQSSWSPTSGAAASRRIRAPPPRSRRRWNPRTTTARRTCAPSSSTTPSESGCGWRRPWTMWWRARTDTLDRRRRRIPDLGPFHGHRRSGPRQAAAHPQAGRLRLVGAALGAGAARPGRRRRSPAASHAGWDGLLADQREYLDDFWERSDVELDGRRRAAAGDPLRPVPHAAGRAPAASSGRSPPRG